MQVRKRKHNPKRRIDTNLDLKKLKDIAEQVIYKGSPYHKRNPGDFGLTPPSQPRPNKTLCDGTKVFEKRVAQDILREGVRRGLISSRRTGRLPENIWAVSADGIPLEAQLDNEGEASYHGYPMLDGDPLRKAVLKHWNETSGKK